MDNGCRPLETGLPFTIRPYDIDFGEAVSNLVFVRWMEDLRYQLLQEHLPVDDMLDMGIGPMVVETHVEYLQPLRLLDSPRGSVWVTGITEARWTVEFEFNVFDAPIARGRQEGVFIDLERHRPVRMPRVISDRYRAALGDAQRKGLV